MGQILTKYKQGALGWAEFGDAIFDPANAIRTYQDFIEVNAITLATTATAVVGGPVSAMATFTTNTGTYAVNSAHGGSVTIATHTTAVANDNVVAASINDFWTVSPGSRDAYFETKISGTAVSLGFAVGLTAGSPATSCFTAAAIATAVDSIMVGRDAGTDTIVSGLTASKQFQLCVRGSTGAMTETVIPLKDTISTSAVYTIGFYVDGTNVQVFVNGVKAGPVVQYNASSGTPGPMGWMIGCHAPATAQSSLTCDYVAFAGTR